MAVVRLGLWRVGVRKGLEHLYCQGSQPFHRGPSYGGRSAVGLRQRLQIHVQVNVICRLDSVQYLRTITLKMVTDCAVINKVEFYFQV